MATISERINARQHERAVNNIRSGFRRSALQATQQAERSLRGGGQGQQASDAAQDQIATMVDEAVNAFLARYPDPATFPGTNSREFREFSQQNEQQFLQPFLGGQAAQPADAQTTTRGRTPVSSAAPAPAATTTAAPPPPQDIAQRPTPQPRATAAPQQQAQQAAQQAQQVQQSQVARSGLQTGLLGAEGALQGGLSGALAALQQGADFGIDRVGAATQAARNTIDAQTQASRQETRAARDAAVAGLGQERAAFDPFSQAGVGANQVQAALSGALGADAQRQAFADFNESPGQAFLRNRAEQSLLRNAAATGGVQSGQVLDALQQQAIGFAQQDLQNQFGRLGTVADRGFAATGQQAALGGQIANTQQQAAAALTGINQQRAQQAQQLQQFRGGTQAQIAQNAAQQAANLSAGTGQNLAQLRTQAGQQIAQNVAGTTGSIQAGQQQLAAALSQALAGGGGAIADLITQAGNAQAGSQQQLATLLANISTGSASTLAGLPSIGGSGPGGLVGQIADLRRSGQRRSEQ